MRGFHTGFGFICVLCAPPFPKRNAFSLTCEPVSKVMKYLAQLGGIDAADPSTVIIPDMDPEMEEKINFVDPLFCTPVLDRQVHFLHAFEEEIL